MKYVSINALSDFEFHDAVCRFDAFEGQTLKLKVKHLNIHKNTAQNNSGTDMEIADALITLEGFDLLVYEVKGAQVQDEKGVWRSDKSKIVYNGEHALSRFLEQMRSDIIVYYMGTKDGAVYFMDASASAPFFTVFFAFERVTIEWNEYKGEAWYTSAP